MEIEIVTINRYRQILTHGKIQDIIEGIYVYYGIERCKNNAKNTRNRKSKASDIVEHRKNGAFNTMETKR